MVKDAYQELTESGALGPAGARVLYRTVAAVARFDRYPPPDHHDAWTEEAITEVAHDFLAGDRSSERLVHLALLANDERSFARLLEAAVRNYFRSQARTTERGRLHRRIRALLEDGDDFVQIPPGQAGAGYWTLAGRDLTVWSGRIDELISVASSVPISVARWRDRALADRSSLRELCNRMLSAADGAVSLDDILGVASLRLGLGRPPLTTDIDAPDATPASDVASDAVAGLAAEEVFAQLTARERLLILVLDEPVREAAAFVGISKSTASEALNRLRVKLELLLLEVEPRLGALRKLVEMAAAWSNERTDAGGSAS